MTNATLLAFYQEEFMHHEDLDGDVARVSDKPPLFRGKPMWRDPRQEKFVNRAEERILKGTEWPDGMKKFTIEGQILLANVQEDTVFFNAKFETGNLRQVFTTDPNKKRVEAPNTPKGPPAAETASPRKEGENDGGMPAQPHVPCVFKEYDLYLQDDTNSDNSLTQWFYFSCRNIKKGTIVKLNMLNLMKDDSLYNQGMRPFVYSRKRHYEGDGIQWHREGFNIEYFYNAKTIRTSAKTLDMTFDPRYVGNEKDNFKKMSTLSFCYEFKYDNDVVFFTHFAPYSYSDVFRYLCKLESDEKLKKFMRIDHICNSLGKVPMYCLTVTDNIQEDYITQAQEIELYRQFEYRKLDVKPKKKKVRLPGLPGHEEPDPSEKTLLDLAHESLFIKQKEPEKQKPKKPKEPPQEAPVPNPGAREEEELRQPRYKKYIFLTSRVHPGETNSQYMLQGCTEFIMSDDPAAIELRKQFIFKIIPILNPDGVIHGNYRASLMGVDLNRRWKNPSKFLHPTIYYAKSLIKFFHALGRQPDSDTGGVVLSCDMHGHSRNMNVFMYACKNFGEEQAVRVPNQVIWAVPENVHKYCPIFSTNECKMALEKDKDTTARIVLFKELGIQNSYTLEATFYGSGHFKKPRTNWIREIEEPEQIDRRYCISDQRSDIHITPQDLLEVGHDFLRGINFAQGRRLLSYSWFDEPKKAEAIRQKEQAVLQTLQKQLEELQAQEREAARLAALEQRQRDIRERKERKAAEKALREQQRLAAQQAAMNGGLEPVDEERMSAGEGAGQVKVRKRKKKKHLNTQHQGFGGWDDPHPRGRHLVEDPAGGTAKTTATEGDKRIVKKKAKKLVEIKDKDGSVLRSIKKVKKVKQDAGGYGETEAVGELPEIASPERRRKGARNPGRSHSKAMLMSIEGDESGQVYRDLRHSKEDPRSNFGLGDSLMIQYNKYAQKGGPGQPMQGSQDPRRHPGFEQDERNHLNQAFRADNAFSPRRGDAGALVTNNKMIDLVEQILAEDVDVGSYQQNVLFPQYGQGQKFSKAGYKHQGLRHQSDGNEQASSKLRQVSHLMNEMVRNNEPGTQGAGPANTIDSQGITIASQPVGVINAKNINFSRGHQVSSNHFDAPSPKQLQGAGRQPGEGIHKGTVQKFRNASIQPYANNRGDQSGNQGQNGFGGMIQGQVFRGGQPAVDLREQNKVSSRNSQGRPGLQGPGSSLGGADHTQNQRMSNLGSHSKIARNHNLPIPQMGSQSHFQGRKRSHQPVPQQQLSLEGQQIVYGDKNPASPKRRESGAHNEEHYDRYKKFELYQRQKYNQEQGAGDDPRNGRSQQPSAEGNFPETAYDDADGGQQLNMDSSDDEDQSHGREPGGRNIGGMNGGNNLDFDLDGDENDLGDYLAAWEEPRAPMQPRSLLRVRETERAQVPSEQRQGRIPVQDDDVGGSPGAKQIKMKLRYAGKPDNDLKSPKGEPGMPSFPGTKRASLGAPLQDERGQFKSFSIKNSHSHQTTANSGLRLPHGSGNMGVNSPLIPPSGRESALLAKEISTIQAQRPGRSYQQNTYNAISNQGHSRSGVAPYTQGNSENIGISNSQGPSHYQTLNNNRQAYDKSSIEMSQEGNQQQFQSAKVHTVSHGSQSQQVKFPQIKNNNMASPMNKHERGLSPLARPKPNPDAGGDTNHARPRIGGAAGVPQISTQKNSSQYALHALPEMTSPKQAVDGSLGNQQMAHRVQIKGSPSKLGKKL